MAGNAFKYAAIASTANVLIRSLGRTLRFSFDDQARFLDPTHKQQYIWALWHNRILMAPYLRCRFVRHREGSVLTSASKDGEILANIVRKFGIKAIRGSSYKRGVQALLQLQTALEKGEDLCLTPDGPRGPKYEIGRPGIIHAASRSGVPIVPIGLDYSRCWRLKSWDRFIIPKPFAECRIRIMAPLHVPGQEENPDIDAQIGRLKAAMMSSIEVE